MAMSDKLPPTEDERCGTIAGNSAHRGRGEAPCDSCREVLAERNRVYYAVNREAILKKKRVYGEANSEALSSRNRAYREENSESIAAYKRTRYYANRDEISRRYSVWRAGISQAFADVAAHGGQPWTAEDDAIIRTTYGQVVVMVAAQVRRTPSAVRCRRVDLRKLDRNQRKVTS